MEERKQFIEACKESPDTFSSICRRFAMSRKTGYKWLTRYNELGEASLEDRPRIADSVPHRTGDELVEAIMELSIGIFSCKPGRRRSRI